MPGREGKISYADFKLLDQWLAVMDGGTNHEFSFSPAISLMVLCKDQEEIDYYYDSLLADGGKESQCGWLQDKFGVAWQIDSVELGRMLKDKNKEKVARVTNAFMRMKKFNIAQLREAFEGQLV